MKERPILFNSKMVRAILEECKHQTRRVITPQPMELPVLCGDGRWRSENGTPGFSCPYGRIGDRLWVRETWGAVSRTEDPAPLAECKIEYQANLPAGCTDYPGGWPAEEAHGYDEAPKWRPSIHMPRWASRITLEITGVQVERVQDITNDDARAEGCEAIEEEFSPMYPAPVLTLGFHQLWDKINAKRGFGWSANPFVWVIAFKLV